MIENTLVGRQFTNKSTYQILKLLWQGTSSQIYEGYELNKKEKIAIKVQNRITPQAKQITQTLSNIQFVNIVNIRDYFQAQEGHIIVMEYANAGNLYQNCCKQQGKIQDPSELKNIVLQILNGIKEMHDLKLIHRDLKPENIVLVKQANGNIIYKICDLGLVRQREINKQMTTNIGTPNFRAPELIGNTRAYTETVDIWAMGCIWYEFITGQPLFQGNNVNSILNFIRDCPQSFIDNKIESLFISQQYKSLLKRMINRDLTKRPSANEIMFGMKENLQPIQLVKVVNPQIIQLQPTQQIEQQQIKEEQAKLYEVQMQEKLKEQERQFQEAQKKLEQQLKQKYDEELNQQVQTIETQLKQQQQQKIVEHKEELQKKFQDTCAQNKEQIEQQLRIERQQLEQAKLNNQYQIEQQLQMRRQQLEYQNQQHQQQQEIQLYAQLQQREYEIKQEAVKQQKMQLNQQVQELQEQQELILQEKIDEIRVKQGQELTQLRLFQLEQSNEILKHKQIQQQQQATIEKLQQELVKKNDLVEQQQKDSLQQLNQKDAAIQQQNRIIQQLQSDNQQLKQLEQLYNEQKNYAAATNIRIKIDQNDQAMHDLSNPIELEAPNIINNNKMENNNQIANDIVRSEVYTINQVKLRAAINNQQLIKDILKIRHEEEGDWKEKVMKFLIDHQDRLVKDVSL